MKDIEYQEIVFPDEKSKDEYLEHHGVLGQRWGVITRGYISKGRSAATKIKNGGQNLMVRGRAAVSKARGKIKDGNERKNRILSRFKIKKEKQKKLKEMSDKELKERVNRLQLEQQYKQLTSKKKSKGRQITEDMLTTSIKTVGTGVLVAQMKKAIEGNGISNP